uniref:Uncharacterized protein n=1 Tax=Parascaris univalens TaxID=6257 RepID=A0A915ACI8_PARUN
MERLKNFWNEIAGDGVDYSQFETRNGDADIIVFRDNSSKFRLFGTNVHVTLGAVIAATVGLMVTITFCIFYTFYHSRGQGRNEFIDHLELAVTIIAAAVDVRRLLFGQVRYDFGWVAFQVGFTAAQGFAIYLVLRCRKYLSAKEHWKKMSKQGQNYDHSIIADGVTAESTTPDTI